YVEASRALAQRVLEAKNLNDAARLDLAFRLATARHPKPAEMKILRAGLERHLAEYKQHPEAATKLLAVGESPVARSLDVSRWAAYTVMANMILNLDETITTE